MQSPPFGILGINNNNPRHTGNPPPKTTSADAGATRQLPPIQSWTLLLGLADVEEKEEKEEKEEQWNKGTGSTKKRAPYMGDRAHTLADTNETLPVRPMLDTDDDSVFADSLQTSWGEAESKGEEERLQQLLLRRSAVQATPIVLVAVAPFYSQASITSTPRIYLRGQHSSSRNGYPEQPRRRRPVRSFEHTIW